VANDSGYFEFKDLPAGTYTVSISAEGFDNWTSPAVTVTPGQYLILTGSKLKVSELHTTVSVVYNAEEVATEQVHAEEHQRVLGFLPNFYVVYDRNPEPLSAKLKFHLAAKTSFDPVTVVGAGVLAAINQAGDTPNYRQGWAGFGERYGAVAADGVSNIMIAEPSCPRFCTRIRATSIKAPAQTSHARYMPSSLRSSAAETTGGYNRTTQA